MAAKKGSLIGMELDKYSKKVAEFQEYLDSMDIRSLADDKLRQNEINVQRALMLDLGVMLAHLKSLREDDEKRAKEVRGNDYVNPMLRKAMEERDEINDI